MENASLPNNLEEFKERFGWEEYVVVSLMLLVSALIGIYFYWKGQKSNAEYLLGGKQMGIFPVSMSLIATMISSISMIGVPRLIYELGSQFGMITFVFPLVMYSVTNWYLPVFWKLGVSTSYEYLEWRFDKKVRLLCSFLFLIQTVLYMAVVVYAPSIAIAQVTSFGVDVACAAIMGVCIFYTTIGGIKAVMWTDTFQSMMIFIAFLAVLIKGTIDAGGIQEIMVANYNESKIEFFNFDTDVTVPFTIWGVVIGGWFWWLSIYGTNQSMVQRYLSADYLSTAVRAIWWNCFGIMILHILYVFAGWIAWAFYHSVVKSDPIKSKLLSKPDQLMPFFVLHIMGNIPGVPGMFIGGILCGSLSSVSSGLSSLAAIAYQDFIQSGFKLNISERKGSIITKSLSIGFGILIYGLIYVVSNIPGLVNASLLIFGITAGPLLGVFSLGMFFPWANCVGAICGAVSSVLFISSIGIAKVVIGMANQNSNTNLNVTTSIETTTIEYNMTTNSIDVEEPSSFQIYKISTMWYYPLSCLICFLIGALVSALIKPQDPKVLNRDLISPAFYTFFRWFPFLAYLIGQEKDFEAEIGIDYVEGEKEQKLRNQSIIKRKESQDEKRNTTTSLRIDLLSK